MFSLDPTELGCTDSTEHTIEVTDNTPFKEQFQTEFPLHWLRRLGATCRKCWNLVPSDPARVLGSMHSCIGVEEGWWLMLLYQLPLPECLHQEGLLPSA